VFFPEGDDVGEEFVLVALFEIREVHGDWTLMSDANFK
jgi:hypothetical protein